MVFIRKKKKWAFFVVMLSYSYLNFSLSYLSAGENFFLLLEFSVKCFFSLSLFFFFKYLEVLLLDIVESDRILYVHNSQQA